LDLGFKRSDARRVLVRKEKGERRPEEKGSIIFDERLTIAAKPRLLSSLLSPLSSSTRNHKARDFSRAF